jgi:7-carboxy-7-deazaguanine synthase
MVKSKITEIFNSIQGEGIYVGQMQTFIRFYGCNLKCVFCDENIKSTFKEWTVKDIIKHITKDSHKTISLTGGEPLLQVQFLKLLLPELKARKFNIYLETNGVLKDNLLEVIDSVDVISMDIKLPSSTALGQYWKEHKEFLTIAKSKETFVKVIVTKKTNYEDIKKAVKLVAEADKGIPFILQPAALKGKIEPIDNFEKFYKIASSGLDNVRIIPQVHKILGVK